jgi:hypothetical protein
VAAAAADSDGPHRGPWGGSSHGPHRDDAGTASGEWFAAYTDYLRRASDQSADTVALYQEVTDRVLRGELSPTVTQDLMNSFLRERGTTYSAQVGDLLTRFFTEMVRINATFATELGRTILPEAAGLRVPNLAFDSTDPAAWYEQVTDFGRQLGESIGSVYQALINRAASGRLDRDKLEEATTGYVQRRLPELLAELGKLYFELLNGLTDVRIRAEREYLRGLLDRTGGPNGDGPFELSLRAPLGETATAALSIENTREHTARVRCRLGELRRADGVGPAFVPEVSYGEDGVELAPGQGATLTIGVRLDEHQFAPGALYVGTLEITGHGDPRLEVPLRIMATEPATTSEP